MTNLRDRCQLLSRNVVVPDHNTKFPTSFLIQCSRGSALVGGIHLAANLGLISPEHKHLGRISRGTC